MGRLHRGLTVMTAPVPGIDVRPYALLIFDADDTLRRTTIPGRPCPRGPGEWELIPGVREILSGIDWGSGTPRFGVASNQDQIAFELLAEDTAARLLQEMADAAIGAAARDALIRLCPHSAGARCICRKPAPGMLLDLCRAAAVPPARGLFVGNAETDREAARRAGMAFGWADVFFKRGEGSR
jgi:D-glycero-D-manno-heptose 1,7-bisphosphate phosphatase